MKVMHFSEFVGFLGKEEQFRQYERQMFVYVS